MPSELTRPDALAAPAMWGDVEPDPAAFKPVSVRPYFKSRYLYRTRGSRTAPTIVRRISATPRPRVSRSRVAQRSRSPGRLGDEPPPEPDIASWRGLAVASVRMVAHLERRRAARLAT